MSLLTLFDSSGPTPAFSANFMSDSLPAGLTYTNSSKTRTYFEGDGLLKTAAENEPIFEHDPLTLASLGMRWEMEQRTNLLTYSNDLSNAAWSKGGVVVSSNVDAAPDGTSTADKVYEDSSTGAHRVFPAAITFSSGLTYTASIYAKAGERRYLGVYLSNVGWSAASEHTFDLQAGTVAFSNGSASLASIVGVGGGWYRCSVTRTVGASSVTGSVVFQVMQTATNPAFYTEQGDGTSGLYLWGAQLEAGASASSYIPTTSAAVTRQPDVLTATSISPWYNQSEGTVVFEGIVSDAGTVPRGIFAFSNGTTSERIGGYVGLAVSSFFCVDGGVTQADLTAMGTVTKNSIFRHVGAYKVNDFAGVLNGGTVRTDTSGTVATPDQLRLGGLSSVGANPFMGYARRFDYYRRRLPDAQLQGMSRV